MSHYERTGCANGAPTQTMDRDEKVRSRASGPRTADPSSDQHQPVTILRRQNARKKTGNSVKNEDTYEALRDKGMSKERAAKISNAQKNKGQDKGKR